MSSTTGIQQLSSDGLLPSSLSQFILKKASASQLSKIAASSVALQESGTLFGIGSSSDTAILGPTATDALFQQSSYNTTDPLTEAVDNALTSNLNAAVNQFLPQDSSPSGSLINVVG